MGGSRADGCSHSDSQVDKTSDGQEGGQPGPECFRENLPLSSCSARLNPRLLGVLLPFVGLVVFESSA